MWNHWCMIQNPYKTEDLVVNRSRTVSPPSGYLVLSEVSIRASPNLDILGVKFDSKLIRRLCAWYCFRSENLHIEVDETYICEHLCYFVAILNLFSQCMSIVIRCWGSAAQCHLRLLERKGVFGGQALSRSEPSCGRSSPIRV